MVLPFDNQPGKFISPLLSALMHLANEAGGQEVEALPELSVKQSDVLPPPPHPEAERLERLLELDAEPPDPSRLTLYLTRMIRSKYQGS